MLKCTTTNLSTNQLPVANLTDNETAKLHIRYMVGGRTDLVDNERLFRFEFPERPGALFNFLSQLAGRWNISMFHYRNHGSSHARVVAGFQVPKSERKSIANFFATMSKSDQVFSYWDETDNPAYKLFLR